MLARTPKQNATKAALDALDARLRAECRGPFYPQPLPVIGTKATYLDKPCSNPRQRLGAAIYNPTCHCGYLMREHIGGAA